MELWEWIAIIAAIGINALMIVGPIVQVRRRNKNAYKDDETPKENYPEPEELHVHAKVAKMECATRYVGIKQPKLVKDFLVFFEDDEGTEYRLLVDEADYCALEEGMTGMLTLIDGQLNGFELDE